MPSQTYIVAGLGNPGEKYSGTRHNIGFDAIDAIAKEYGVDVSVSKWDGVSGRFSLQGQTVHLVKPMTFMNRSGKCLSRFIDFFKVPLENVMVIHDDLDMKTGRLKLVYGGGAGGHNGIRSIVDSTGDTDFYRLKVGIGRPGNGGTHLDIPVERYVLMPFLSEEIPFVNERLQAAVKGVQTFITETPARAVNYINSFKTSC